MATKLSELSVGFVSLVPMGADQDAHVVLAKALDIDALVPSKIVPDKGPDRDKIKAKETRMPKHTDPMMSEREDEKEEDEKDEKDEKKSKLPAFLQKALKGVALTPEQVAAVVTAVAAQAPKAEEPVVKSAELVAVEKELSEQRAITKALREESDIAKAAIAVRKEYPSLGAVDYDALAGALHRIGTVSQPADVEVVKRVLKAADGFAEANALMTRELGTAAPVLDGSPEAVVEKIATGLRAANPKLTVAKSVELAALSPEGQAAYAKTSAKK